MSIARQVHAGKHCFIPCPPHLCNCGRNQGNLGLQRMEELRRFYEDERRREEIVRLRSEGKHEEALALALNP